LEHPRLDAPARIPMIDGTRGFCNGVRTMTRVVIDIVLFSFIFAVVTGIVIAAANLLI
jgi:hypothetical protein